MNIIFRWWIGFLMASLALAGCSGILPQAGKPSPPVKRFALEYATPAAAEAAPLDAVVKVERFSAVGMLNGRAMLYRSGDYRFDLYNYYVWIDNPADMICDSITRDLRDSGLFRAAFSFRSPEQGRFRMEGALLRFFEDDEKGAAVIELSITLFDVLSADTGRKIVFQKNYEVWQAGGRSADALAAALSAATREISGRIIQDVRAAAGKRLAEDNKSS